MTVSPPHLLRAPGARPGGPAPELSRDRVCLHRGPVAARGTVTLTATALQFRPASRADGLVAAGVGDLEVASLTEASLAGLERHVRLRSEAASWRLSGAGAVRVLHRLWSLRPDLGPRDLPRFAPGERVIVQGTVRARKPGGLPGFGDLYVTDRRVRFCPWPLGGLVGPEPLDVAPGRARLLPRPGLETRGCLLVDDTELLLAGDVVGVAMAVLPLLHGGAPREAGARLIRHHPVQVLGGRGPRAGVLVVSPAAVAVQTTGDDDRCLLATTDIRELSLLDDSLAISGRGGQVRVRVGAADARLEEAARAVRAGLALAGGDLVRARMLAADIDPADVSWADAVLWWPDGQTVRPGVLVLDEERLRFLPLGHGEAALSVPREALLRPLGREDEDREVVVRIADADHRFRPVAGPARAAGFWLACAAPTRVLRPSSDGRLLRYVATGRISISLGPDGRDGLLVTVGDGLDPDGVVLPGVRPSELSERRGMRARVSAERPEGVYRFDATIRVAPGGVRLDVPAVVRLYNRREACRAPVGVAVDVRIVAAPRGAERTSLAGDQREGTLRDVSTSGVGLVLARPVPIGARLMLSLSLETGPVDAEVRVERVSRARGAGGCVHGARFLDLDGRTRRIIAALVVAVQRASLSLPRASDADRSGALDLRG
jgi:hypothetical protein